MAQRNVPITPGSGDSVSFDDNVQRVKLTTGATGTQTDVSAADPLPVSGSIAISSSALPSDASTESTLGLVNGKLPSLATDNPGADDNAIPTRQVPLKVHACSFAAVGSGLVTPEMVQIGSTGTGITVAQSGGNLTIATGTSTNAEFLARSAFSAEGAHVLRYGMVASQRIANQNLMIALADLIGDGLAYSIVSSVLVDVTLTAHGYTAQHVGRAMFIGAISGAAGVPGRYVIQSIPDANTVRFTVAGWPASGTGTLCLFGFNYHRALYTGTTATNVLYDAQREGWASGDTTATINTSASPGHIGHIQSDCVDATYSDSLRASNTGYQFSTRATRVENMPDQDVLLYVFLWSYNGTVAPASTTTWTINFLRLEDLANTKVYLAGMTRGGAGNSVATSVIGTVPVSGSVTATGIAGPAAHDAAISGNPVRMAGRAITAAYATVATGDTADLITTLQGVQIVKQWQIPELEFGVGDRITASTTATQIKAASASLQNYSTGIIIGSDALGASGDIQLRSTPVASTSATIASNTLVMAATYGWKVGDLVYVTASTVTGLTAANYYYILTVSGANLTFSATRGGSTLAISGTTVSATLSKILWRHKLQTASLPVVNLEFENPVSGGINLAIEMCTPVSLTSGSVDFHVSGYVAP